MIPIRDDVPTRLPPVLVLGLIAANVLVFGYQIALDVGGGASGRAGQAFVESFGMVPRALLGGTAAPGGGALPPWLTPFTSMFLHGGLMHLGGNMLYLWIFGNNIEDLLGHGRFVVFYLACGLAASATHVASAPHSTIPVIGASGAISGVLGAYALSYPTARVRAIVPLGFFWTTVHLPAFLLLLLWFVVQVFSGVATAGADGPGVAWWAHIGGFVAGLVLGPALRAHPPVRERLPL